MTYNHESYIRQCLEGFVMQKTTFRFEVFVHDDASTDNTPKIVKEFEEKYPDIFTCIYQTENQFKKHNALTNILFPMAKGKYIALCEGDDFWISENKLQLQVDILENNPSLSFCFHEVKVLNEISNIIYEYPRPLKTVLEFRDILSRHYVATCSLVIRKSFLPVPFPAWFNNSSIGDIPIELMLADKGNVYFIDEKLGCYRRNIQSLTSDTAHLRNGRKMFLYVYTHLNRHFSYRYWYLFAKKILMLRLGYIKDIFRKYLPKS